MTQRENRGELKLIPIMLAMLSILMVVGGASALTPDAGEDSSQGATDSVVETVTQTEGSDATVATEATNVMLPRGRSVATVATNPWHNYPNACETFTVIEGSKLVKGKKGKKFPVRYRRNRFKRKKSDQYRTRDLIKMVVKEMGGDSDAQRIVSMIAMHESSWNPEAIHILNPDLSANAKAWERHTYSRSKELSIEARMKSASKKTNKDGYYGLKARLADIRLYKGNPHWDDELEFTYRIPEREYRGEAIPASEWQDHRSVWAFGYGLYGMNAVLFTHIWDKEAPPWILCGDEGIQATVTIVWALRRIQAECAGLSAQNPEKWGHEGGSAYGVVRRFARGRCSDKRLGKQWRKLMAGLDDIDWSARPDFGDKFPRYEMYKRNKKWRFRKDANGKRIRSDRAAILAHMREKAAKKKLLRATPLERKVPGSEPVIVSRSPDTVAVADLPPGAPVN